MNLASILEWVGAFFVLGEIRAFFMPKFRREEENYGKQNTGYYVNAP